MTVAQADAQFAAWMKENLATAAGRFGLTITGEPVLGWRLRSISAAATRKDQLYWLRVVSQEPEWAQGDSWTGTVDANSIDGISKPRVLDVAEWDEGRRQRAEVMTMMPGETCSPTDALRSPIDLPAQWWESLGQFLGILAATSTARTNTSQIRVTQRIEERFGADVETVVDQWETVHGDLHWSNLVGPDFGLLDWELWGRGPRGTDAATLLCHSLLVPAVAADVHNRFRDVLDTSAGRIAQLYVVARLLHRIDNGDYPDLAEPLKRHASSLLASE
ncbi:hypothetical protein JOF56_001595 [Kibdelosporangium banguiense]|uniref:Aminoglycoside phosphotransferase n=1 Tax=Kibdelosporangium banguiense TaxID=1365924 RepID=A0ABS4T9V4_9PSEU|nr:aminoglycoside phosphotransferase [Kibdelosporangium banguiense]MBP2321210.1 hypothetical protein [Kibdelosporangium banguiense]